MASEAQRRAIQNYKKKVKRITVDFSPAESQLWEHIQNQPNKQGYIKSLIRDDLLFNMVCDAYSTKREH